MKYLCASALLCLGCSSSSPTTPSPTPQPSTAPASIQVLAATRQDMQLDVTAKVLSSDGATLPNVSVTFTVDNGTITPAQAVTDANGLAHAIAASLGKTEIKAATGTLSSTLTTTGNVQPPAVPNPPPSFGVSLSASTVTVGTPTPFIAATTGTAGVSFAWDFGDGSVATTASATTSHAYSTVASYTATVIATDAIGRTAHATTTAIVNTAPLPPTIVLALTLGCVPSTHGTLTACNLSASWDGHVLPSTAFVSAAWDFGDGTARTITGSPLASNTYAQAGTYFVSVHVTADATSAGGPATAQASIMTTIVIP